MSIQSMYGGINTTNEREKNINRVIAGIKQHGGSVDSNVPLAKQSYVDALEQRQKAMNKTLQSMSNDIVRLKALIITLQDQVNKVNERTKKVNS